MGGAALRAAILLASAGLAGSCTQSAGTAGTLRATVVVLPDTQFYACAYSGIFHQQAQWVVDHKDERGIALVVHTGDVVDVDEPSQWQVAAESMHRLDGVVPYLIATGNHDLSATRGSLITHYFAPSQLAARDFTPDFHDPARLDNSFGVIQVAGRTWLFIGLEFAPRNEVVMWASEVLSAHADLPAVLFTHAYLYSDGSRYDRAVQPLQPYHPDQYGYTVDQGVNDGEDLWRKLVEPHENVRLVLSAHVIPNGTARSIATRTSGTRVHQVLANYQTCAVCPCAGVEGGEGYLRLLDFDAAGTRIHVSTYSPHLGAFLANDQNDFVLELD